MRKAWLIGAFAGIAAASAAPYVPTSDGVVLEHVTARSELDRLEPLRRRLAVNSRDLEAALTLAKAYLTLGRTAGDSRFTGYAEAALLPWMTDKSIPEPVLVLQATALQNRHQFAAAMELLDRAMRLNPLDPQVWLTRATLFSLRNDVGEARHACARLTRTAGALLAIACLAGIDSRNGRLHDSYAALQAVYSDDARITGELQVWILTQLADMAERSGDDRVAEDYLIAALRAVPQDSFALAAYADLLNRTSRSAQVLTLLRSLQAQDNLLLRLCIAQAHSRTAPVSDDARGGWARMYADRVAAAKRDGDTSHLREQAWFALDVERDAAQALRLAAINWQRQREPADVRIYWRAAVAAGSTIAQAQLRQWFTATHYEDATLIGVRS